MKLFAFLIALLVIGPWARAAGEAPLPTEVEINGVEFVLIPEGWVYHPVPDFDVKARQRRGSGVREPRLWIDAYYLAKYEARARDFLRFMREGKPVHASHYDSPGPLITGSGAQDGCAVRQDAQGDYYLVVPEADLPVTHLSWDLANEFTQWMGFRLASEAEWMRAFRGDDKRVFPWGNEYPDDTYAAFQEGATPCNVQPVTAYAKGRSPFGIYNMAGNVYEYTADWLNLDFYAGLKDGDRNPVSTTPLRWANGGGKDYRILRGGRWASGVNELTAYGNRDLRAPNEPFICFGVRFALDAATVRQHLAAGTAVVR